VFDVENEHPTTEKISFFDKSEDAYLFHQFQNLVQVSHCDAGGSSSLAHRKDLKLVRTHNSEKVKMQSMTRDREKNRAFTVPFQIPKIGFIVTQIVA
jgi:hypothetical protein